MVGRLRDGPRHVARTILLAATPAFILALIRADASPERWRLAAKALARIVRPLNAFVVERRRAARDVFGGETTALPFLAIVRPCVVKPVHDTVCHACAADGIHPARGVLNRLGLDSWTWGGGQENGEYSARGQACQRRVAVVDRTGSQDIAVADGQTQRRTRGFASGFASGFECGTYRARVR